MKCSDTIRSFFICLVFSCVLSGCGAQQSLPLDKDDLHFAGFYSDYLLESGVVAADEGAALAALDAPEVSALLLKHALTQESLKRKIEIYKKNPELWKSILVQVRATIVKKTGGAE